jgi:hypothetical protein
MLHTLRLHLGRRKVGRPVKGRKSSRPNRPRSTCDGVGTGSRSNGYMPMGVRLFPGARDGLFLNLSLDLRGVQVVLLALKSEDVLIALRASTSTQNNE